MGTRVGTRGENGYKMRYFGSDFSNFMPDEYNEKRPKCVKIKHLGRFTMAEKEGFEPLSNRGIVRRYAIFAPCTRTRVRFLCDSRR